MVLSPDPQQEKAQKDAEIAKIIARREQEMNDAKASVVLREQEELQRKALEEKEFQKDVAAGRVRAEEKEEWRQGQHEKRRELERDRLRKIARQKEEDAKHAELERKRLKQKEYMNDLHRASMVKKAKAMRKQALLDLEKAQITARDHRMIALREMDFRAKSDRRQIETETALQRKNLASMGKSLTPILQDRRAQDIEILGKRKLEILDQAVAAKRMEIEHIHTAELAKAAQIKTQDFVKADETQKL